LTNGDLFWLEIVLTKAGRIFLYQKINVQPAVTFFKMTVAVTQPDDQWVQRNGTRHHKILIVISVNIAGEKADPKFIAGQGR